MLEYITYYLAIGVTLYVLMALIDNSAKGALLSPNKELIVFTITVILWAVLVPIMLIAYYKYYRYKDRLKKEPQ